MSPVDRQGGEARRSAFYYDDGNGRAVKIRWWLPYGHPERVEVIA